MKNEAADYLRSKLEIYRLTSAYNSAQYINNSLTSFLELNKTPGEAILESHAVPLFMRGVKDPEF